MISRSNRSGSRAFAAAAVLLFPVALVHAEPGEPARPAPIEEMVVTAELRDTSVYDSTLAVSVISLNDQKSTALNHLEEVLGRVPNVNLASGASRARFFQVRGIGERGQFEEPVNASVGLMVDGVDFSGIGTAATLYDVSQVEVLRGPQGTLYGANALAGLIDITTNDPSQTLTARIDVDAANYAGTGLGGVLSGPLSERLSYRLAGRRYRDDGFMENAYLNRDNTANHDESTWRGKLVWTPTDRQEWTLSGGRIDIDNGYDAFSLDNNRTTLSDQPGMDAQRTDFASLAVAATLNDAVSLETTLALARADIDYGYDEDWTFVGFDPAGYSSTDRYLRDRETGSVDVRLLSAPSGRLFGGTTDWVIGVYYLTQDVDLRRQYTFFEQDFTSSFAMDRVALYGEISRPLSDRTRVSVGLRAERHDAQYRDSAGVRFDPQDDLVGGRLVIERDLRTGVLGYLSATRGYKAGGFNASGTLDPSLRRFDPEYLWNYELGIKGRWLDDRLGVRLALFHMRRDDVQVATLRTITREDGSSEFIQLTENATKGVNQGLEIEAEWTVVDALTLIGNLGLLDAEFENYVNDAGEILGGEDQAHAPRYQFYLAAEYRFAPGWYARLEAEGRADFYFSDSPRMVTMPSEIRSQPYEMLHAVLGYSAGRWQAKLWARNLTDEDSFVRGFYFPNDPREGYPERGYTQLGEPRRYGVSVSWQL